MGTRAGRKGLIRCLRTAACTAALAQGAPAQLEQVSTHGLKGGVAVAWEARWDGQGSSDDSPLVMAVHGHRAYLLTRSVGVDQRVLRVLAYDTDTGALLWSREVDSPGVDPVPLGIEVSNDGGAVFVGDDAGGAGGVGNVLRLTRYDALTGEPDWVVTLAPPTTGAPAPDLAGSAMDLSVDGTKVYLLGRLRSGPQGKDKDLLTAAFDAATGVELWHTVLGAATADDGYAGLAIQGGGGSGLVFVAGNVQASPSMAGRDLLVVAYSAADGALVWSDVRASGGTFDTFYRGASLASGALVLSGNTDFGPISVAYDAATGAELWSANIGGPSGQLVGRPDGSVLFLAERGAGGSLHTLALAPLTGAVLWDMDYSSTGLPVGTGETPGGIAISDSGTVVLVTSSSSNAAFENDYATVAYRANTGEQLWARVFDGVAAGDDRPVGIGVDAGGTVVVTGLSEAGLAGVDTTTVAYDFASGSKRWEVGADFLTSTRDEATALAVSGSGARLYTGGRSIGVDLDIAVQGVVQAFDSATGQLAWSASHFAGTAKFVTPSLEPLVNGRGVVALSADPGSDLVYVLVRRDNDFVLAAHDGGAGTELWSVVLAGDVPNSEAGNLLVSPLGGKLYVTLPRNGNYATMALDGPSGAVFWDMELDSGFGLDVPRQLELAPDQATLFVSGRAATGADGFFEVTTAAYDTVTGQLRWQEAEDAYFQADVPDLVAAPDGSALFVAVTAGSAFSSLHARDAATGAALWSRSDYDGVHAAVSVASDSQRVYVVDEHFELRGYDASTGTPTLLLEPQTVPFLDGVQSMRLDQDGATLFLVGDSGFSDFPGAFCCGSGRTAALDAQSGMVLWRADYSSGSVFSDQGVGSALSADGTRLYALVKSEVSGSSTDVVVVAYEVPTLVGGPGELSVVKGGTQELELRAGSQFGGAVYLLLGSAAGTSPGLPLGGGVTLPLNPGGYFQYTLSSLGAAPLVHGFGVLDAKGRAGAAFALPPDNSELSAEGLATPLQGRPSQQVGQPQGAGAGSQGVDFTSGQPVPSSAMPSLAGIELHHAFVVLELGGLVPTVTFASNPLRLELEP